VELNGAQVLKELPFVVGVMSDLSGNPDDPLPKVKDRKFTEIDRDNFDAVLKSMKPRLAYKAENTLADDGSELSVELNFEKLADFEPEQVARQIGPLNDLLEIRTRLKALLSKTEGNDRLEELLEAIMDNAELRDKLKDALGAEGPDAKGSDDKGGE
jgi:type VI secretion system protein ImpB